MTRKDYVAIAEAFYRTKPTIDNPTGSDEDVLAKLDIALQWLATRKNVADVFAADNPRFDRGRFYRACEGEK